MTVSLLGECGWFLDVSNTDLLSVRVADQETELTLRVTPRSDAELRREAASRPRVKNA